MAPLLVRYLCIKLPLMLPECERARERNILVILHQVHRYITSSDIITFTSGDLHSITYSKHLKGQLEPTLSGEKSLNGSRGLVSQNITQYPAFVSSGVLSHYVSRNDSL